MMALRGLSVLFLFFVFNVVELAVDVDVDVYLVSFVIDVGLDLASSIIFLATSNFSSFNFSSFRVFSCCSFKNV